MWQLWAAGLTPAQLAIASSADVPCYCCVCPPGPQGVGHSLPTGGIGQFEPDFVARPRPQPTPNHVTGFVPPPPVNCIATDAKLIDGLVD
jgi:hypothetical protein